MGLADKIRNTTRIDNRRQSKGTICRIIEGAKTIAFMKEKGLVPIQVDLHETIAVDPVAGRLFVVPLTKLIQFETEVRAIGTFDYDTEIDVSDRNPFSVTAEDLFRTEREIEQVGKVTQFDKIQEQLRVIKRDNSLADFLRQTTVMLSVPTSRWPDGGNILAGNRARYDVLVETLDVNQAMDAQFVMRTVQNLRREDRWSDA